MRAVRTETCSGKPGRLAEKRKLKLKIAKQWEMSFLSVWRTPAKNAAKLSAVQVLSNVCVCFCPPPSPRTFRFTRLQFAFAKLSQTDNLLIPGLFANVLTNNGTLSSTESIPLERLLCTNIEVDILYSLFKNFLFHNTLHGTTLRHLNFVRCFEHCAEKSVLRLADFLHHSVFSTAFGGASPAQIGRGYEVVCWKFGYSRRQQPLTGGEINRPDHHSFFFQEKLFCSFENINQFGGWSAWLR